MAAATPTQPLFFQLYKNRDDDVALKRVQDVVRLGYKAIFLTVDALVPGNREEDIRCPWVLEELETGKAAVWDENAPVEDVNLGGTAGNLVNRDDRNMTWEKVISPCLHVLLLSRIDWFHEDRPVASQCHQFAHCHQRLDLARSE